MVSLRRHITLSTSRCVDATDVWICVKRGARIMFARYLVNKPPAAVVLRHQLHHGRLSRYTGGDTRRRQIVDRADRHASSPLVRHTSGSRCRHRLTSGEKDTSRGRADAAAAMPRKPRTPSADDPTSTKIWIRRRVAVSTARCQIASETVQADAEDDQLVAFVAASGRVHDVDLDAELRRIADVARGTADRLPEDRVLVVRQRAGWPRVVVGLRPRWRCVEHLLVERRRRRFVAGARHSRNLGGEISRHVTLDQNEAHAVSPLQACIFGRINATRRSYCAVNAAEATNFYHCKFDKRFVNRWSWLEVDRSAPCSITDEWRQRPVACRSPRSLSVETRTGNDVE